MIGLSSGSRFGMLIGRAVMLCCESFVWCRYVWQKGVVIGAVGLRNGQWMDVSVYVSASWLEWMVCVGVSCVVKL